MSISNRVRRVRSLTAMWLIEANGDDADERARIEADPLLMDEATMRLAVDVLNLRMALRRLGLALLGQQDEPR